MRRLYLVRHAHAAPGDPDELRPLTEQGRDQARLLAERLAAAHPPPRRVVSSPLLRARETAALLAQPLGVAPEVDDRLAPGATPADVRAAAEDGDGDAVVVAHQPDCSHAAAALGGGSEPAFPPAGLHVLELA